METAQIRWLDGRFADPGLERAYLAFAWPGARLQSALTIAGLSLGLVAAFLLVDRVNVSGTQVETAVYAMRLGAAIAGLAFAGWLSAARPGRDLMRARLGRSMLRCFWRAGDLRANGGALKTVVQKFIE